MPSSRFCKIMSSARGPSQAANAASATDKATLAFTEQHYFSSYDHFGIHEEMLKDTSRTLSYRSGVGRWLRNGNSLDVCCEGRRQACVCCGHVQHH